MRFAVTPKSVLARPRAFGLMCQAEPGGLAARDLKSLSNQGGDNFSPLHQVQAAPSISRRMMAATSLRTPAPIPRKLKLSMTLELRKNFSA